jgi:PST family polysaccharide transporter
MLKAFFKDIKSNMLIKLASLNSIAIIIKVSGGFLTSKVIAVFLGAEGLALVGNLRNFLSSTQALSTLGLNNGLVKYVSEFKSNKILLGKTVSTVFLLGFFSTIIVSLSVYFNAFTISNAVFGENLDYSSIIKIAAIVLPFYVLNVFVTGVLNGLSKFNHIIVIRIIGHVFSAATTIFLIWKAELYGALLAVVIIEVLLFLVTCIAIVNRLSFTSLVTIDSFSFRLTKKLSSYSIMALFSAFTIPLVAFLIRDYITENLDLKHAGYWEAMNRISKYYLLFISSLLALYVLPKFAEINTDEGFRKEVFSFYKTIMPIFGLGLIVIYLLKTFIIQILFVNDFSPVEALFKWQLLGDFIKVFSLVIGYQLIAKRMILKYLIIELSFMVSQYFLSCHFIDVYGIEGVTLAYFYVSVFHLIIMLLVFRKALFSKKQNYE